jgi:hypothetical protein
LYSLNDLICVRPDGESPVGATHEFDGFKIDEKTSKILQLMVGKEILPLVASSD